MLLALLYLLLPVSVRSDISFNFTSFTPNTPGITYSGDAHASGGDQMLIQLTRNQLDESVYRSAGQAVYSTPIDLWNPTTGAVANFTTTFKFKIVTFDNSNVSEYGDGLAFFMAPVGYGLQPNSSGAFLGLFNETTYNSSSTNVLAVEFDTYMNEWDPDGNHVGIDIDSIISNVTADFPGELNDAEMWKAQISYSSISNNLSVHLMRHSEELADEIRVLSYNLNLTEILPPTVIVGFSASTGGRSELHQIVAWNFTANMSEIVGQDVLEVQPKNPSKNKHIPWIVGSVAFIGFVIPAFGYLIFSGRRLRKKQLQLGGKDHHNFDLDTSIDSKIFVTGCSPRRFGYKELVMATNNFSEERKLGQGGFGGVYLGFLNSNQNEKIAVKKISSESTQGKKEYISEVNVISRLRHKNLVRLIGWCHEYGEFLLVYEYMPKSSLDLYIFGKKDPLAWDLRYKIILGLASGLVYLHEEYEQCVIHRDIKPSNVMLDSDFNAKLGDFGLARLIDHAIGAQTTMLAGTMGYLAPECVMTSRASKESDVYSFGVVALEIACGRKAIDPMAVGSQLKLVDWVWELFGNNVILDAADRKLYGEFDKLQLETMMVLGLWCVHPDSKLRPSIRQAIQVLKFESPLPSLPKALPKPTYDALPMDMINMLYDTSVSQELGLTGTICYDGRCNTSSDLASSSAASSQSLLL